MKELQVNGKTYTAYEIFDILDKKDGKKDNYIDRSIWNQMTSIQLDGKNELGNKIKFAINKENGTKSISTYLRLIENDADAKTNFVKLLGLEVTTSAIEDSHECKKQDQQKNKKTVTPLQNADEKLRREACLEIYKICAGDTNQLDSDDKVRSFCEACETIEYDGSFTVNGQEYNKKQQNLNFKFEYTNESDATRVGRFAFNASNPKNENVAIQQYNKSFSLKSNAKTEQKTDSVILNNALNNLLKKYGKNNSKLENLAPCFVQAASDYGIDPFFLIAISAQESAWGTSNFAQKYNNIGGINDVKAAKAQNVGQVSQKFDSPYNCVNVIAKTINSRINEDYTTIGEIANSGKYCAKSSADTWGRNVVWIANQIKNEYNRLLDEANKV